MHTSVPPASSRTRTSSRRRRALASCALPIFPAITDRSPNGAWATIRRVRGCSPRAGRGARWSLPSRRRAPGRRHWRPGPPDRSGARPPPASRTAEAGATATARAKDRPGPPLLLFVDGVLDEQHLEDLVFVLAARCADLHRVAHLAADQPARDRAGDADAPLLQIGFGLVYDGVLDLLPAIDVLELHRRSEHHPLAGEAGDVDDLRPAQAVLQHLDPALDVRLPFLGGMVLGVLAQVAVVSRDGDLLHDAGPLDRLQALDLALDGVGAGLGHRDVIACHRLAFCE